MTQEVRAPEGESINEVIAGALEGSPKKKAELAQRLRPLILSRIQRIMPYARDVDHEISGCTLKLMECLESYNPQRGAHFLHYYKVQLEYHLLDRLKAQLKEEVPMEEEVFTALASPEDVEAHILRREEDAELHRLVATLAPRERQVIELLYFHELSLSEVAGFLNIAYKTAANTKYNALEKLRRNYATQQKTHPL